MPKRIDITGQKFSHLTVLRYVGNDKRGQSLWECLCDCGNKKIVTGAKLRWGEIKSCGCAQHQGSHGLADSPIYNVWRTMKARCLNPNNHKYKRYGGRGITICDEWKDHFEMFYEWAIANGYAEGLSIDRIDNNGNYCPENCRWATAKEQSNNTHSNVFFTHDGQTHTIAQWAEICGITKAALYHRLERGWSIAEALTTKTKMEVK